MQLQLSKKMGIKKGSFIKDKLIVCLICLFGVFPILPSRLKGLPVVVLFIVSIFFLKKEKRKFNVKGFFKLSSLFFVLFLSIFYTGSFYFPIDKIETSLSLFIIPLSFYLIGSNIKSNHNRLFIKCFIFSTTVLSITSIFYYYFNNLFKKDYFKVNSFRKLIVEIPIINDHPIYISLYLAITILFSIAVFPKINKNKKVILIVISLINVFHLFLLSSKGIIIAVLISVVLLLMLLLNNTWTKLKVTSFIIVLFIFGLIYFPNLNRRFKELTIKTTYTELQITNSTSLRISVYKCAIEKIKQKPILGYGWGAGDMALIECYKEKSEYLYREKLNSHNQYLDYYLNGGIIAILVLMYFLYQQLIISIREKKYLFTSIIILFGIQMLSENILNRQSGIIIFIFIISLLRTEKRSYD